MADDNKITVNPGKFSIGGVSIGVPPISVSVPSAPASQPQAAQAPAPAAAGSAPEKPSAFGSFLKGISDTVKTLDGQLGSATKSALDQVAAAAEKARAAGVEATKCDTKDHAEYETPACVDVRKKQEENRAAQANR